MERLSGFCAALIACALIFAGALAIGEAAYQREFLPECYAYLTLGASNIFSETDCTVYAQPNPNSMALATLVNGMPVEVHAIDREAGWAEIDYFKDTGSGVIPDEYPSDNDPRCGSGYARLDCIVPEYVWQNTMTVLSAKPGDRVHLRAKADKGSASLGKYYSGVIVRALESGSRNGYRKVQIGHMVGYMDERYLRPGPTVGRAELYTVTAAGATGVNMRKLPGKDAEIIKTIPNGAAVTVISVRTDDWIQVVCEGEWGYAKRGLFKGMDRTGLRW